MPVATVVAIALVALVAGVAASWIPARMASAVPPLEALADTGSELGRRVGALSAAPERVTAPAVAVPEPIAGGPATAGVPGTAGVPATAVAAPEPVVVGAQVPPPFDPSRLPAPVVLAADERIEADRILSVAVLDGSSVTTLAADSAEAAALLELYGLVGDGTQGSPSSPRRSPVLPPSLQPVPRRAAPNRIRNRIRRQPPSACCSARRCSANPYHLNPYHLNRPLRPGRPSRLSHLRRSTACPASRSAVHRRQHPYRPNRGATPTAVVMSRTVRSWRVPHRPSGAANNGAGFDVHGDGIPLTAVHRAGFVGGACPQQPRVGSHHRPNTTPNHSSPPPTQLPPTQLPPPPPQLHSRPGRQRCPARTWLLWSPDWTPTPNSAGRRCSIR